jgi:hypothetical protein
VEGAGKKKKKKRTSAVSGWLHVIRTRTHSNEPEVWRHFAFVGRHFKLRTETEASYDGRDAEMNSKQRRTRSEE